jgi:DNA-binding response OmpR family regulator
MQEMAALVQQLSVLVVGDHLDVRVSAARFLKASGFIVFQATDARSAVRLLGAVQMSAVLVDGDHLPDAATTDLLGFMASRSPRASLVYLTARDPAAVHGPGVTSVVHKPCDPAQLLSVLRDLCEVKLTQS